MIMAAGSSTWMQRRRMPLPPASVTGAAGLALLAAATLDGIPENLVLGISLGKGSGGIALLAAIFAANFPEALVSSASMRTQGRSHFHPGNLECLRPVIDLCRGYRCRTTVAKHARDAVIAVGLCRRRRPRCIGRHAHTGGLRTWRPHRRAEYRGGIRPRLRPFAGVRSTARRHMGGSRLRFSAPWATSGSGRVAVTLINSINCSGVLTRNLACSAPLAWLHPPKGPLEAPLGLR